jgi:hypothetical protein
MQAILPNLALIAKASKVEGMVWISEFIARGLPCLTARPRLQTSSILLLVMAWSQHIPVLVPLFQPQKGKAEMGRPPGP